MTDSSGSPMTLIEISSLGVRINGAPVWTEVDSIYVKPPDDKGPLAVTLTIFPARVVMGHQA